MKNLLRRLFNWFSPAEPAYYYRMNSGAVEKITASAPEPVVETLPEEDHADVPLFTVAELQEMKKADLLELAINSGIHCEKKETKKSLITKITHHYELQ